MSQLHSYTHAVYVDDAGRGLGTETGINKNFTCAAIEVDLEKHHDFAEGLRKIKQSHLRPSARILRGSRLGASLNGRSSEEDVLSDISQLFSSCTVHGWVMAVQHDSQALGPGGNGVRPAVATGRQLLIERLNGYLRLWFSQGGRRMVVMDHGLQHELRKLAHSIGAFQSPEEGVDLHHNFGSAPLSGRREEWVALQASDLVAHYALHHSSHAWGVPEASESKADLFRRYILPNLDRNAQGRVAGIGYKLWPLP